MWDKVDDSLKPFRTSAHGTRMLGHAGPPTAKATEAYTKFIVTDMFAKAAQGTPPAEAVAWAADELRKIYEA
jgi:multiple sugar transport system substrate-binding protein